VDFAGVAGIMEAEQEVMILGGIVMAFFLVLLLIISTAKRNDVPRSSHMSGDTDRTMHGQGKPRITELTNIEGPVKELMPESTADNEAGKLAQQLSIDSTPKSPLDEGQNKGQSISSSVMSLSDDEEGFKVFRRTTPAKPRNQAPLLETTPITDELRLIEQSMMSLKDMFRIGYITRDVYVDETRMLYNQAKSLAEAHDMVY
jgi:hypothetical protein